MIFKEEVEQIVKDWSIDPIFICAAKEENLSLYDKAVIIGRIYSYGSASVKENSLLLDKLIKGDLNNPTSKSLQWINALSREEMISLVNQFFERLDYLEEDLTSIIQQKKEPSPRQMERLSIQREKLEELSLVLFKRTRKDHSSTFEFVDNLGNQLTSLYRELETKNKLLRTIKSFSPAQKKWYLP